MGIYQNIAKNLRILVQKFVLRWLMGFKPHVSYYIELQVLLENVRQRRRLLLGVTRNVNQSHQQYLNVERNAKQ